MLGRVGGDDWLWLKLGFLYNWQFLSESTLARVACSLKTLDFPQTPRPNAQPPLEKDISTSPSRPDFQMTFPNVDPDGLCIPAESICIRD